MKKLFGIFVGLTGAVVLPSSAQNAPSADSPQIYGRADASVNFQRRSGTFGTKTAVGSDTSYLGFRGTEDLGGGLKAYFKGESGFDISTGNQSAANLFNRESYVGVTTPTMGSVQLGTAWTPAVWLTGRVDPFGRSQLGAFQSIFQGTGSRGHSIQFTNSVQYVSPLLSNIQGRLYWAAGEGVSSNSRGAALDYFGGDLYVGVAYDQVAVRGTTVGLPAVPEVSAKTLALGGSYKFPLVKLSVYAQKNQTDSLPDVNGAALGATVPVGTGEYRASYSFTGSGENRASLGAVGYHHFLSKRTAVYTSYGVLLNGKSTRLTLAPTAPDFASTPMQPGQSARGIGFGIRHTW